MLKGAALLLLIAAPATTLPAAQQAVRCSFDDGPDVACRLDDTVVAPGVHRMIFHAGKRQMVFQGRSLGGWWSGRLGNKPAMGYERNRGNVVFSTTDGAIRFAWWYPGQAHGNY